MTPPLMTAVAEASETDVATQARARKANRTPTEARPHREQFLYDLTDQALARGITDRELDDINVVGDCKAQVETRIAALEDWLNARPATA